MVEWKEVEIVETSASVLIAVFVPDFGFLGRGIKVSCPPPRGFLRCWWVGELIREGTRAQGTIHPTHLSHPPVHLPFHLRHFPVTGLRPVHTSNNPSAIDECAMGKSLLEARQYFKDYIKEFKYFIDDHWSIIIIITNISANGLISELNNKAHQGDLLTKPTFKPGVKDLNGIYS